MTNPMRGSYSPQELTLAEIQKCRWLIPTFVTAIEFLEWTQATTFGRRGSSD
jgi:hypothetical protein